jgi:hypothetical protein
MKQKFKRSGLPNNKPKRKRQGQKWKAEIIK